MRKGSKAQQVLADKAYASKANRTAMKGKHRGSILQKDGTQSPNMPIAKAL